MIKSFLRLSQKQCLVNHKNTPFISLLSLILLNILKTRYLNLYFFNNFLININKIVDRRPSSGCGCHKATRVSVQVRCQRLSDAEVL